MNACMLGSVCVPLPHLEQGVQVAPGRRLSQCIEVVFLELSILPGAPAGSKGLDAREGLEKRTGCDPG